jgi:predicted DNA repair protein MutK
LSIGLIALLDDIAGLAKAAAASLDDVAAQTARAGVKAAGVVIDDTAVTPGYVVGLSPARELPIIGRIALGSLRNKLLILLPVAIALKLLAPWAVTPLLMLGGAYLCFEGAEKVCHGLFHRAGPAGDATPRPVLGPKAFEERKVASAIKTDFILSAEIMAITLAAVPEGGILTQAIVLALVGLGITAGVYGAVALIVKADDVGLALAATASGGGLGRLSRAFGRGLVRFMPALLQVLGIVGTAAMIWVGGGIVVHGLEGYGWTMLGHAIEHAAASAAGAVPAIGPAVAWVVGAAGSGVVGLALGTVLVGLEALVLAPALAAFRRRRAAASPPAG